MDKSDRESSSYLLNYWRKAPGRARRASWEFVRHRVAWNAAMLVVGAVVIRAAWNARSGQPIEILHEVAVGLLTIAGACLLVWLWHLFIVTPARTQRNADERHQADQAEIARLQERHREECSALELTAEVAREEAAVIHQADQAEIAALRAELQSPVVLALEPLNRALDPSWFAGPALFGEEQILADNMRIRFAMVRVLNNGPKHAERLTAEVTYMQDGAVIFRREGAAWSAEQGPTFVVGGPVGADISVGSSRLLLVAALYEKLPDLVWYSVGRQDIRRSCFSPPLEWALPASCTVHVRIRTDGVAIDQRFLLRATDGEVDFLPILP
jgi:hypothetical protein